MTSRASRRVLAAYFPDRLPYLIVDDDRLVAGESGQHPIHGRLSGSSEVWARGPFAVDLPGGDAQRISERTAVATSWNRPRHGTDHRPTLDT